MNRRPTNTPRVSWRDKFQAAPTPRDATVSQLAREWVDILATEKNRSLPDRKSAVIQHFEPEFGELLARDLCKEHVEAFADALEASGYSQCTRHKLISHFSVLLTHGIRTGAADKNVVKELPRGWLGDREVVNAARAKLEVLSWDEILLILHSGKIPTYRRVLWAFQLYTGARESETFEVRLADIHDQKPLRAVVIQRGYSCKLRRVTPTKVNDVRIIPVHPDLSAILADWLESGWRFYFGRDPRPDDLLIPHPTGQVRPAVPDWWHATTALKDWHADLGKVKIAHPPTGPRRLHCTRHTFKTRADACGIPENIHAEWTHPKGSRRSRGASSLYVHTEWAVQCKAMLRYNAEVEKRLTSLNRDESDLVMPVDVKVKAA